MIGSVFEFQNQMAEQERRRQEAAAQQAATAAVPVAVPATAPLAASAPAAGYAPAAVALKAAEPDIGKRRKKERGDRKGHDLRDDAATGAADEGRGYRDAVAADAADDARKNYADRGATEGPGGFREPARPPAAEAYDRPYIDGEGHAAESPQAELPRQSPITHAPQGIPQPIELPGAVTAGYVPAHIAAAYSLGSPSDR